jgi:hypothetical protein
MDVPYRRRNMTMAAFASLFAVSGRCKHQLQRCLQPIAFGWDATSSAGREVASVYRRHVVVPRFVARLCVRRRSHRSPKQAVSKAQTDRQKAVDQGKLNRQATQPKSYRIEPSAVAGNNERHSKSGWR